MFSVFFKMFSNQKNQLIKILGRLITNKVVFVSIVVLLSAMMTLFPFED